MLHQMIAACLLTAAEVLRKQKVNVVKHVVEEGCKACCMMRRVHATAVFWSSHRKTLQAASCCAHRSAHASAADHPAALDWQHPGCDGGASSAIV